MKFISIEPANNANVEGIHSCIKEAFERVGMLYLSKNVITSNVDGAVVNTGVHHGVSALMKESSPWLQVIHYSNQRLQLSIKDAFKTGAFVKMDEMSMKLYLYQKSPKRLRELKLDGSMGEISSKAV